MTTFVIKPVFWNTKNYTMPSGAKATSGYPYENGYGHEEWNNAPRMRFRGANDQPYRVFHTEPLGKFPVEEHANEIMIFMIASHGGVQYLVGVAGNAR
ncbi:MAG: HNH endonuclease, partial [Alphaproteobacteria bacterium]|nr:HNH endonuclease [Alphaproteobacteria bacterium]